jgi:putative ABC transport system substrate-binding protein
MASKVAFLHSGRRVSFQLHYATFVRRLYEVAHDDDIEIIEKWAGDDLSRALSRQAEEVANEAGVDVIVAAGGPPSSVASRDATKSNKVPVVFMSTADPVALGLVVSLDKPGTNMTGIAGLTSELDVKRLELLREFLAGGAPKKIGVLTNGGRPSVEYQFEELKKAAPGLDLTLVRRNAVNLDEIKKAFADFKGEPVDGVLVTADSLFNDFRKDVVAFAKGLPAIYQWREFAEVGGLMSFGPNILEAYALVGEYAGRILNGATAANLPVSLPDSLELVINLRVAHAEGFNIPASLLSRAEFVRHPLGP